MRSRPIRASSTFCGTLPLRKPGIFVDSARSDEACSTACLRWSVGTSTSRRTRLSGSSSDVVFTTRPFCQHLAGLGLALKKGLRGVELMNVRAAVFFLFTAAVALFVHPADTGDLAFFVHTSQKWLWGLVVDPSVQSGPLHLLVFASVTSRACWRCRPTFEWPLSSGSPLGVCSPGATPKSRFAVVLRAAFADHGAYQDGIPPGRRARSLWVRPLRAPEGRHDCAPGALLGLSAGLRGLGACSPSSLRTRFPGAGRLRGLATDGVAVALFLRRRPGEFRMFESLAGEQLHPLGLVALAGHATSLAHGVAGLARSPRAPEWPGGGGEAARGLARAAHGRRRPDGARPGSLPVVLARRTDARPPRRGRTARREAPIRPKEASKEARDRPMTWSTCREPPSQPLCFPPRCSRPRRPRTQQHPR